MNKSGQCSELAKNNDDKAQDAEKNKASQITAKRELEKQQYQNYVDLYDSRTASAEAKENIQTNAKDKNKEIDTQIKNTKLSYENQIKIAKLSKDKAEQDRLEYEKQQKIKELQEQKLQNYVDEYNASADLAEINSSNAVGYEKQNMFINTQLSCLQKSYAKQIEIAKLNGDITEEKRLQAEYDAKETELKQQQIDNLKKDYENRIGLINNGKQDISNSLSETEAKGDIVQAGFYSSLNSYEEKALADLREELGKLQEQQNTFDKYSQKWYDLQSDIQNVENSISETNISIIENNKKIGELRQTMYDDISSRNSDSSSEAQFLAGLLGDNLTDDKTGSLTKEGLGVLGSYGIELEANNNTASARGTQRKEIEDAIAAFKSGDLHALDMYGSLHAAEEKLNEVIKKQQEAISASYSSMKDIYDLMVKEYETQLSYMQSIINAKKQVLSMEKDLYDYEKNIRNQTKNIATLEKQLAAVRGDDSEEGRARAAKLLVSLDEANQELQDTEYDRYISDQQDMLDNMYTQYEDLLNALEKDFEAVVQDGLNQIAANASGISETLNGLADQYGYNPSDDMKEILNCLKIYETDENGNILKDTDGNPLVKTLPAMIKTGLSDLGTVFSNAADKIITAYGGSGSGGNQSGGDPSKGNPSEGDIPNDRTRVESQANEYTGKKSEQETQLKSFLKRLSGKNDSNKPLKPAEKGKTYASDLNKILSQYGYVVKSGTGDYGMKYINKFAQSLGLMSGDGSYKSNGLVYKTLSKKYPYLGFRTGGIVRADGVPKDGDHVSVRVNPDETILTQDFTKMLPDTVDTMKNFTKAADNATLVQPMINDDVISDLVISADEFIKKFTEGRENMSFPIKDIIKVPDYANQVQPRQIGNTFGDIVINAELPNVENTYDFANDLKNNKRTQRSIMVSIHDVLKKGRITQNIQRI